MSDDGTDRGDPLAGLRASPSDTWPDRYEIFVSFAALDGKRRRPVRGRDRYVAHGAHPCEKSYQ
jgi:hypothetical protein